jgi:predicted nucleic acid-binding protein
LAVSIPTALQDIGTTIGAGWIKPRPREDQSLGRLLRASLDAGEAEAIALALELSADLILLDEKDGRSVAARAGLRVTGVLGVAA